MIQIGRFWVGALLVVLVGAVLGCSDDGDAVRAAAGLEPEVVAESALLSVGDLPSGDWNIEEQWRPEPREAQPEEVEEPAECGSARTNLLNHEGVLTGVGRILSTYGAGDDEASSVRAPAFQTSVMVFDGSTPLEEFHGEFVESQERWDSEECQDALDAQGIERFYPRVEEPRYGLPDSNGTRVSFSSSSSPTNRTASEIHTFVRGRVFATYVIIEAGDLPPEFDPQALLEAFAARVVAAQE